MNFIQFGSSVLYSQQPGTGLYVEPERFNPQPPPFLLLQGI